MDNNPEFIVLDPKVMEDQLDLVVVDNDTDSVLMNGAIKYENGKIEYFVDGDESTTLPKEDITLVQNVLTVPGVGYVTPGARVILKEKDYILLFGWHTNVSNQHIYSWYLRSVGEVACDKTLYYEMINDIEVVHFK